MTAAAVLFVLAGALFIALVVRGCIVMLREERWLPREIASGKLLFSEQTFKGPPGLPIVARIDRAYLANGRLHLVELKMRRSGHVYDTDIIELSAQRVAVVASKGMDVSDRGYVIVERPESHRRVARPVALLNDEEVAHLVERRRAILDGTERPVETCAQGRCARCEYRRECKGKGGSRMYLFIRPSGKH